MAETNPPTLPDPNSLEEIGTVAEQSAEKLGELSGVAISSQESFNRLNKEVGDSSKMFLGLNNMIKGVGISLNTTQALTTNQATQFSLLSNSVLGARESYKSLAGTDFSGFRNQIDDLLKVATESPLSEAGKMAKGALESVAAAGGKTANEIAQMTVETLGKFATSLLTSADNALRLQTGFIGLAGRTGSLNSVFSLAGDNLENINILLEKQSAMMSSAMKATGAAPEAVEKYYMALGTVPGALASVVASTKAGDESVTMLTAAMKVASGTGRDFTDIVDDLKVAFRDYGMTGESALRFSVQISEVTQKLGVELDTVKNALRGGADAFKMFAHTGNGASQMASDMADIMAHYGQALESTGLQGAQAVDVVSNMTKQIGQMSIAQKSFLSQQTGGAGGLMGAFQIDKMIREGDLAGVFEKVRAQMQKQFGKIVSVDEASQSEAAANQMTKQITMLRQGPLGQFARSNEEAESILEGFKAAQEGKGGKAVSADILATTMDRGTSVQEKSYSVMSDMRTHLEAIRRSADIGSLSLLQKSGITAGQGVATQPGEMLQNEGARDASGRLRQSMASATNMGTSQFSGTYADVSKNKELIDTTGKNAVSALMGLKDSFKILPLSIKGVTESLRQAVSSGDLVGAQEQNKLLKEHISKLKATTTSDNQKAIEEISKLEAASGTVDKYWELSDAAMTSGATVGVAANRAAGRGTATPEGATTAPSGDRRNPTSTKQDITVHVTGFCIKCKQEMESGHQAKGVAPQAQ